MEIDVIGIFLPPVPVLAEREQAHTDTAPLKTAEDAAVRDIVERQLLAGLKTVTSGGIRWDAGYNVSGCPSVEIIISTYSSAGEGIICRHTARSAVTGGDTIVPEWRYVNFPDNIMHKLLPGVHVDRFYLPFNIDDEHVADVLRHIPHGKKVVLGLSDAHSPWPDDEDAIQEIASTASECTCRCTKGVICVRCVRLLYEHPKLRNFSHAHEAVKVFYSCFTWERF